MLQASIVKWAFSYGMADHTIVFELDAPIEMNGVYCLFDVTGLACVVCKVEPRMAGYAVLRDTLVIERE